jgi:hypothetical protein
MLEQKIVLKLLSCRMGLFVNRGWCIHACMFGVGMASSGAERSEAERLFANAERARTKNYKVENALTLALGRDEKGGSSKSSRR